MENKSEKTGGTILPDYTLRKKYVKRPSNVIKIRLKETQPTLEFPENNDHCLWVLTDNLLLVVIKTWQFGPIPRISQVFKNIQIENVTIEFNLGPHDQDGEILEEMCSLNTSHFSLEFREHWAGFCPKTDQSTLDERKDNTVIGNDCYSDEFIVPFMKEQSICDKIRVITGRISVSLLQNLSSCTNLQFLGIRVNSQEYKVLTDCIENYKSLERIHILPQWKHDGKSTVDPIRFDGIVTIYYGQDMETTQAIKKALKKWKQTQTKPSFFCWSK